MSDKAPNLEDEEIKRLREVYKAKLDRIRDCEDALLFYSHVINYETSVRGAQSGITYQNKLKDDFESADNDHNTMIAGRRAREYFRKYARDL